jgi:RND family efflux transporter MFP subunit
MTNTFFRSLLSKLRLGIRTVFSKIRSSFHRRPSLTVLAGAVVVGLLYTGALFAFSSETADQVSHEQLPEVSVTSIADIQSMLEPLTVIGSVRSETEATILAESAGRVTRVTKTLGSYVASGEVIAELENAGARASVLQAEGAVQAAESTLRRVSGSTREEQLSILETNVASAEQSLKSAEQASVTALLSAYASVDDALRRKTDVVFTDATSDPRFLLLVPDATLIATIETTRKNIETLRKEQQIRTRTISETSNILEIFTTTQTELRNVREYLDLVVEALNKAIATTDFPQSTINTYRADAILARSNITASMTSVSTNEEALRSRISALEIAEKNLEQGITGGAPEEIQGAEAALIQARAGLAQARAGLAKTIIRAPFSGTINALYLDTGEFISAYSPAVTIANNNLLEIRTAVTEQDASYISTGSPVTIENGITGRISSMARALDPLTKKIEVRIAITDAGTAITNGQSVRIEIPRTPSTTAVVQTEVTIPLTALKFTPDGPVIFTVEEGVLVAHQVTPGTLLGNTVQILSGTNVTMEIVTDARGLKAGDRVTVKNTTN